MVCTRVSRAGVPAKNPGVEPVEYLWRLRGSYFYLVREIAESSRETRKIYLRYFALSPAYPAFLPPYPLPPPTVTSGSFYSASLCRRPLSRVLLLACGHAVSLPALNRRKIKNGDARLLPRARKGPFYLHAEDPSSL